MPDTKDLMKFVEYPDPDQILEGPQPGVMFEYVSNTYLNGLINYVSVEKAFLVRRYKDSGHEDVVREIEGAIHPNLNDHDDCFVIGSSHGRTHFWFFWYDLDCSDCCVGRAECTLEEMDLFVQGLAQEFPDRFEIDVDKIRGWISG